MRGFSYTVGKLYDRGDRRPKCRSEFNATGFLYETHAVVKQNRLHVVSWLGVRDVTCSISKLECCSLGLVTLDLQQLTKYAIFDTWVHLQYQVSQTRISTHCRAWFIEPCLTDLHTFLPLA